MKLLRPLLVVALMALIALFTFLAFKPGVSSKPSAAEASSSGNERARSGESPGPHQPSSAQEMVATTALPEAMAGTARHAADSDSFVLEDLTETERRSLWQALSEARREVRKIRETWAEREQNLGFDFYAQHPTQNLTARFGPDAVQVVSSKRTHTAADANQPTTAWEARLRLRAFAGRGVAANAAPEKSQESGSRVEYRHGGGLTEWYDNGVEAMEHGFTVAARPGHLQAGEEVVLEMSLEGLQAALSDSVEGDLVFRDGEREVLGYTKLVVFDASGRELPARMAATEDGFLIAYHDADARYPVTVDPLLVNEEAKLTASDAGVGDEFGYSVSISGDTVVVGAPFDNDAGSNSGSAYVFTRSGAIWSQQAKLTASDAAAGDSFGISVSISGETVVVGAFWDNHAGNNSGSAYIFTRSGGIWGQQSKLTASDAAATDYFGGSVSISGDTVVVGSPLDDDGGNNSGSAYVFTRSGSTWSQQAKLTASDAAADDQFGRSVSISGDTAVVGAFFDDHFGGSNAGSAYVFARSDGTWSQQAKLHAADTAAGNTFGRSVSIAGDMIIVGARRDNDAGGFNSGAAYVFIRNANIFTPWSQQAKLTASDAATNDSFGFSVSISGDTALVGAYGAVNGGSAYVFTRSGTTWSQQAKLTASDAAPGHQLGWSVSLSGNTAVVGAPRNHGGGNNSGSAYSYRLAVPSVSKLLVMDHLGNLVSSGGAASAFDGQRNGTLRDYSFTLTNAGELDLDLQTISLEGADAGQFSLVVPDISSPVDLTQNQSLTLTVTFQPVAGSGLRNATLKITSNDTNTTDYLVNLSGLGLSDSIDTDGDGMTDWAEHALRGFGFDWQLAQPNLVADYYALAPAAGLVALDDIAGLQAKATLLHVNPATNRADFTIQLKQSANLTTPFSPIIADPARITVDGQGRIVYEVDAIGDKSFYLMEVSP